MKPKTTQSINFKDTIFSNRSFKQDVFSPKTGELLVSANRKLTKYICAEIERHGVEVAADMLKIPYRKQKLKRLDFISERIRVCAARLKRWEDEYGELIKQD